MKNSSESKLQIGSICSIEILKISQVIPKILNPNQVCDQKCENGECLCTDGYTKEDGKSCKKESEIKMVTIDENGTFKSDDFETDLGSLVDTGFVTPTKSCFHRAQKFDIVCMEMIDKKWQKSVFTNSIIGPNSVVDMAYDEISGNYYYVLYPSKQIWVCSGQFRV